MITQERLKHLKRNLEDRTDYDVIDLIDTVDCLVSDLKNIRKHHEMVSSNSIQMSISWHMADRALKKVGFDE